MQQEISSGNRLGSMIIDHITMSFINMIFFIPFMISSFSTVILSGHEEKFPQIINEFSYIGLLGLAIYFNKDAINGRSIAKRIFKFQVVNNESGEVASPLRCLVRNLFCILWPIEVIVALSNPERRIGDKVAGTKLVLFNAETDQPVPKIRQIVISIGLAYVAMLLLMLPAVLLDSALSRGQVSPIKTSINVSAGKETLSLLKGQLGHEISSDILIYDHIEEDPDLKYISIILTSKYDYLANDIEFEKIDQKILSILFSKYPKGTFVGKVKYIHLRKNGSSSGVRVLDWRE